MILTGRGVLGPQEKKKTSQYISCALAKGNRSLCAGSNNFFADRKNENTQGGKYSQYGGSRIQIILILLNSIWFSFFIEKVSNNGKHSYKNGSNIFFLCHTNGEKINY